MADFIKCAELSELAPGASKTVEVAGRALGLFNVGGTIHCLDNTCLHRGGPLGEGTLEGEVITCPWHHWQYNVRTGENLFDPGVKVTKYSIRVEGNDIKVSV
jgi:3-phenylpropionate/trans-cinnamate dioxygenase ferredoxin component